MAIRVAYGKRDRISAAIAEGVIPKDTIIITDDSVESELLFYNHEGELNNVAERTKFHSLSEATEWVKKYDCRGLVFSIHNGADWSMYQVQDDGSLSPVIGDGTLPPITSIDGGNSSGV